MLVLSLQIVFCLLVYLAIFFMTAKHDIQQKRRCCKQAISIGIWQGCILSHFLFNLHEEYIMWNAELDEPKAGIKIARRNINNLRYTDDIIQMVESKEELKSLLMRMKEESEKAGLKLYMKKSNIMASGPISSVQFSHSVASDSLRPHGLQHARPPCPSPTPEVYPNSCALSWWCHLTISSSVVPFSACLHSFLASGSNSSWEETPHVQGQ